MNSDLYSLGAVGPPDDRDRVRQRRLRRHRPAAGQPGRGLVQQPARRLPRRRASWSGSTSPPTPRRWAAHAEARVDHRRARRRAFERARCADRTTVIVIATDPHAWTEGGAWWEVGVPEMSEPAGDPGRAGRARRGQGRPAAGRLRRSRAPLRVGVLGCGRIGRMHAELLAQPRRRAPSWSPCTTSSPTSAPTRRPTSSACRRSTSVDEALAGGVDAVAICTSTDTHVELIIAAAEAGVAVFCEKPISLDLAAVDHALGRRRRGRRAAPRRVQPPLRSGPPGRAATPSPAASSASCTWCASPAATRRRRRSAYIERSGGLFLDMTIHDLDMARFVAGSEVRRGVRRRRRCGSTRPSARPATSTPPSSCCATPTGCLTVDRQQPARASTATTSASRRSARPAWRPRRTRRCTPTCATTPTGRTGRRSPTFFLDRYVTSYVRQWEAFVDAVATGGPRP